MKLKWFLVGLGTIIVIIAAAVAIIVSTMSFDDLRPLIQDEARKATGRDLAIGGPIALQLSLTPSIQVEDVSFANAEWGSRPAMATVKAIDLQVSLIDLLGGEIKIDRLVLVEPDILLETNAEGRGNWSFAADVAQPGAEPTTTSGGKTVLPGFDRVEIENGRLTYRDGATGRETQLALKELSARAKDSRDPLKVSANGTYDEAAFTLDGTLGSLDQIERGPYPVDLTLQAGGATVSVVGDVAEPLTGSGIDVKIGAKGEDLTELARLVGTSLPFGGAYSIAAQVALDGATVKLSGLDASLAGSRLTGDGSVAFDGRQPKIGGDFKIDKFNLAAFGGGEDKGGESGRYVFSEEPLPLDWVDAVDADINLAVGTLNLTTGLALNNLKATAKLANGTFSLNPLTSGLSGGSIVVNLSLNDAVRSPRLRTSAKAKGIDAGRLLKALAIDQGLESTLDANLALQGRGTSARAIAAGLNGQVEATMGKGTLDNDLLDIAAAGLNDILSPLTGDNGTLPLNCMIVSFDIKDGLATSRAIVLDTDDFTVIGGGTVDLKTEALDLSFKTETKEVNLASLSTPFDIRGTLASPTASPNALGLATGVAKLAGTIVMPLPAIAGMIGDSSLSGSEQSACLSAIEAAGSAPDTGAEQTDKSAVEKATEGVGGAIEGVGEGISKGLKSLFGD
jgi:uncharacterized protein involved in outer membrane biogenesis